MKPVQVQPPVPAVRPLELDEIKIIPNRKKFILPIALLAGAFLTVAVIGIFFIYRIISNQAAGPPGLADPIMQTATALALALSELSSTQQAPAPGSELPLPSGEGG